MSMACAARGRCYSGVEEVRRVGVLRLAMVRLLLRAMRASLRDISMPRSQRTFVSRRVIQRTNRCAIAAATRPTFFDAALCCAQCARTRGDEARSYAYDAPAGSRSGAV